MLQNLLDFNSTSPVENELRVGLFIFATCFLILMAARLAIPLVSLARVKARRVWIVEPPRDGELSTAATLLFGEQKPGSSGNLLSEDVRRMLAQTSNGIPRAVRKQQG